MDIKTRDDASRADYADIVANARGIFFGGGDQSRITRALLDRPLPSTRWTPSSWPVMN